MSQQTPVLRRHSDKSIVEIEVYAHSVFALTQFGGTMMGYVWICLFFNDITGSEVDNKIIDTQYVPAAPGNNLNSFWATTERI